MMARALLEAYARKMGCLYLHIVTNDELLRAPDIKSIIHFSCCKALTALVSYITVLWSVGQKPGVAGRQFSLTTTAFIRTPTFQMNSLLCTETVHLYPIT